MSRYRAIEDYFFQIGGRNYEFDAATLVLGTGGRDRPLHITDDWALTRLREPVAHNAAPQPMPLEPALATGFSTIRVTMVSPEDDA